MPGILKKGRPRNGSVNFGGAGQMHGITEERPTDFCYINISGEIFKTRRKTLHSFPRTLLGSNEKERYYDDARGQYCFARDRQSFGSILYYYQSGGTLRRPPNVNEDVFNREVFFFKIRSALNSRGVMQSTNPKIKGLKRILSQKPTEFMHFKKLLRIQMIDLVVTIMFVLAVICEQLVQPDDWRKSPDTRIRSLSGKWTEIDTPLKIIMSIETLCTLWITTFLILRFYWSEDRTKFAKSFMAIMDSFVVMSYFITLVLFELEAYLHEKTDSDQNRFFTIYRVMACLRMIKLFRMVHVFNLARYNALFFSLGMAVKDSMRDLAVIFMFIFFCIVAYATIMFWVEFDFEGDPCLDSYLDSGEQILDFNITYSSVLPNGTECSFEANSDVLERRKFDSIFSCMWWSLITITTVGYGDMVPTSTTGKIVGACCACSGVPLIAIPLPIISQKFDIYYRRYCKRMEKRSTRKDNERLGSKWVNYLDRPFFDTNRYMADVIDDAGPAWRERVEQRV